MIVATEEVAVLYGVFHFLRHLQTEKPLDAFGAGPARASPCACSITGTTWTAASSAATRADRSGDWDELPDIVSIRAIATTPAPTRRSESTPSALNNVNASAQILTAAYLRKVAALADVFRPYGIRVFLSARFSAPIEIGGLQTADPLDAGVADWWRAKADEIFALIPDFGGFLVKANSEGQPGPQDYGRTHADGANMLADALAAARRRRDLAGLRLQGRRRRGSGEAGL